MNSGQKLFFPSSDDHVENSNEDRIVTWLRALGIQSREGNVVFIRDFEQRGSLLGDMGLVDLEESVVHSGEIVPDQRTEHLVKFFI